MQLTFHARGMLRGVAIVRFDGLLVTSDERRPLAGDLGETAKLCEVYSKCHSIVVFVWFTG
jgi:hypothetical protein